ncbi:hypothetical protein BN133_1945 [Cronobacter dublinensis 582]|nr:hypothetical protein BN133_1945 [Cronobacter dublinensis 582]
MAPLATTGASIASSDPVSVTLVETIRCGALSSVCTPRLSVIWRGQSAACESEEIPKTSRLAASMARRAEVNVTTTYPVRRVNNASHFHHLPTGCKR